MRVLQILIPCSDDFVGPFDNEADAVAWAERHGLNHREYIAHDMASPIRGGWQCERPS